MSKETELHQKNIDLISFHEKHKSSYEWVYRKAVALEVYSSGFKKFAVHFAEAKFGICDNGEKYTSGEDNASIPLDINCELMRGEDIELTELTGFLEGLKAHCGNVIAYVWRDDLKEIRKQTFKLPFADPVDNQLFIEQLITLKNEEEILRDLFDAQKLLRGAVELFENLGLSQTAFHNDLFGQRKISRFLFVVSEMVAEAATAARTIVDLIHANESRWRELNEKAAQFGLVTKEPANAIDSRVLADL